MDPNVPGSSNPDPNSGAPFRRNPDGSLPDDWPGAKPKPGAQQQPATPGSTNPAPADPNAQPQPAPQPGPPQS